MHMRWGAGILVAAAGLSFLPVGSFVLDPTTSQVEFFVSDNRGGFGGVARGVQATVAVREHDGTFVADADVRIDTSTITTGSGLRDGQMRRDFLLSDRYPVMTFHGTAIPTGSIAALSFPARVTGQLTIKETTHTVEFPVRVIALQNSYLVDGTFTLRMTDFGIPIPQFFIFVASDPIVVTMRLRFASAP
jgi:polyisoprenoid-binding protein YceI